jgi:hypothetical protein
MAQERNDGRVCIVTDLSVDPQQPDRMKKIFNQIAKEQQDTPDGEALQRLLKRLRWWKNSEDEERKTE